MDLIYFIYFYVNIIGILDYVGVFYELDLKEGYYWLVWYVLLIILLLVWGCIIGFDGCFMVVCIIILEFFLLGLYQVSVIFYDIVLFVEW